MPYMDQKGISRPTAERFLVGRTQGRVYLKESLLEQGFSESTLAEAGLLNQYGDDFFRDQVIVPIRSHGQVVAFYGRALADNADVRHLRMRSDRTILGEQLFNWNPARTDFIAVEGIFDALALIDRGFNQAVATFGTQGLASETVRQLLLQGEARRVWICYDGDSSGRDSATRDGYAVEDLGLDTLMVDLGDQDPNDFMQSHSREDFQKRLDQAHSPVQWEIRNLNPEWGTDRKIKALEGLMQRTRTMKPLHREATIKQIARTLGLKPKTVTEHIKSLAGINLVVCVL